MCPNVLVCGIRNPPSNTSSPSFISAVFASTSAPAILKTLLTPYFQHIFLFQTKTLFHLPNQKPCFISQIKNPVSSPKRTDFAPVTVTTHCYKFHPKTTTKTLFFFFLDYPKV